MEFPDFLRFHGVISDSDIELPAGGWSFRSRLGQPTPQPGIINRSSGLLVRRNELFINSEDKAMLPEKDRHDHEHKIRLKESQSMAYRALAAQVDMKVATYMRAVLENHINETAASRINLPHIEMIGRP